MVILESAQDTGSMAIRGIFLCLLQLFLDPFYCTIDGICTLIEKELLHHLYVVKAKNSNLLGYRCLLRSDGCSAISFWVTWIFWSFSSLMSSSLTLFTSSRYLMGYRWSTIIRKVLFSLNSRPHLQDASETLWAFSKRMQSRICKETWDLPISLSYQWTIFCSTRH